MLWLPSDLELIDDLERVGVNHIDPIPAADRDVNALRKSGDSRTELARTIGGIDIVRVDQRGHSRKLIGGRGTRRRRCNRQGQRNT
jgi:hypothetical protein